MLGIRLIKFLYVVQLTQASSKQFEQCSNSIEAKERTFEDLPDLQSNADAFRSGRRGYRGSSVVFSAATIPLIPRNAFVTFDCRNILKITLKNKKVSKIEDGAFNQLGCLIALDLSANQISAITKWTFEGVGNLTELDMSGNVLEDLPEEVFENVPRLRKLRLANNKLNGLKRDSFSELRQLEELDLSNNRIKVVSDVALRFFKNLRRLQLASNGIEDLRLDGWKGAKSLSVLNLSHNALESFDMSVSYSFRSSLAELYLNKNHLTTFFTERLRERFQSLVLVDLNDNLWKCDDLFKIVQDLGASGVEHPGSTDSNPNVEKIACNRSKNVEPSEASHAPVSVISEGISNETVRGLERATDALRSSLNTTEILLLVVVLLILACLVFNMFIQFGWYRHCRGRRQYIEIQNNND